MAYDSEHGVAVLFGGFDGALDGETWLWNGGGAGAWQQRAVAGPSARQQHAMAFDPARQRVVLFGGQSGGGLSDETWEWNGDGVGAWILRNAAIRPSPRSGHAMVYHATGGMIVLFGGQDAGAFKNDIWVWNGTAWSGQATTPVPPRRDHAMVYDSTRGVLVIMGGYNGAYLDDVWEWDGASWQIGLSGPSDRRKHAATYDDGNNRIVVFGGEVAGGAVNVETWEALLFAAPTIVSQPTDESGCTGAAATFTVQASGGVPLAFQWRLGGVSLVNGATGSGSVISGATTASVTISNIQPSDAATNYNCRVTNTCGGATSANAALVVDSAPVITMEPENQIACGSPPVIFTVAATGSPTPNYQWRRGTVVLVDGPTGTGSTISGASTDTLLISAVTPADAAPDYNCMLDNMCGMVTSQDASLVVVIPGSIADPIDGIAGAAYGPSLAVQRVQTGFGDNLLGVVDYANGSELDQAFGIVANGVLHLVLAGNLESNFNKLEIFIDSIPGGQNRLRGNNTDVDFNGLNRMGDDGSGNGLRFDADFSADYWIGLSGGGSPYRLHVNYAELPTNGSGQGHYLGNTAAASDGTLMGGTNPICMRATINNSNTAGVTGGTGPASGAGVVTGVELAIPLSAIGGSGCPIKVCAFVNGIGHDFVSNQVLDSLYPISANFGEPRAVDFGGALMVGNQHFSVAVIPNQSAIRFVDADRSPGGDGRCWVTAYSHLQDALAEAGIDPTITQIWVASGIYKPTQRSNPSEPRSATFSMRNGLSLYGGFAGFEADIGQRDPSANVAILSGDRAGNDQPNFVFYSENCFHVVLFPPGVITAVLDGFTIKSGNAEGDSFEAGGGTLILGAATFASCNWTLNRAWSGGAVANQAGPAAFANCTFSENYAYVEDGGALINLALGSLSLDHCSFDQNVANLSGGAVHASGNPTLVGCTFHANRATFGHGGGVYLAAGDATLTGCTFASNLAPAGDGGGLANVGTPLLSGCSFETNSAFGRGGGVFDDGDCGLADCNLVGNSASLGGGLYREDDFNEPQRTVTGCAFAKNTASEGGGAYLRRSWLHVNRCTFSSNTSTNTNPNGFGGGGIRGDEGILILTNCTFVGNRAAYLGGGIEAFTSNVTLFNCTILENYAAQGGGVSVGGLTATNCVLWGNDGSTGQLHLFDIASSAIVNYSCVQGGWTGSGGVGILDKDPIVVPDGHLRTGSPCVDAGTAAGAPFDDLDGDIRPVGGGFDIGCDEFTDSDFDSLPDAWEQQYFGSPTNADPSADPDGDGMTNLAEYEEFSSNPIAPPYFVNGDPALGSNFFDGRAAVHPAEPPGNLIGPKRSIQAALDPAQDGDSVLVAPWVYAGTGNINLYLDRKQVVVRAPDGPTNTIINIIENARAVDPASIVGTFAVLDGFLILNGNSDYGGGVRADQSRLMLKNCVFQSNAASVEGGGLYAALGNLTLHRVTIDYNSAPLGNAGVLDRSNVNLLDSLRLSATPYTLVSRSSWFYGPGRIDLGPAGNRLFVTGAVRGAPPTVLRSNVRGTGDIQIDGGQTLRVEQGAVIDLSGQDLATDCITCVPTDPALWGTIRVDGHLVVNGATIQNSNVTVRLSDIQNETQIINNDIRLIDAVTGGEATANFGGEFFVAGDSEIMCNVVRSEGDRYLDLDPDPSATPRPTICNNKFYVIIKQGRAGDQGELLELRSPDLDINAPDTGGGLSGAYPLAGGIGYADTWAFEELEVLDGAKVNLTNRQGFVFQDPSITADEALYVNKLVLRDNAVLNTGLQRLYYQQLVDRDADGSETTLFPDPQNPYAPLANGSRFVDHPLLGFSLKIIAFDDPTPPPANEFDVRVRTRLEDPGDEQPLLADGETPETDPDRKRGLIQRGTGACAGDSGVMTMSTHNPARQPATSVAAHGAFARAGEDEIIVGFLYRFCGDSSPGQQLVVYLSDVPEPRDPLNPSSLDHIEIARVFPPRGNRPGSIGSCEFAEFFGIFQRAGTNYLGQSYSLNFTRGTYVELELIDDDPTAAPDACVQIDDWDPLINCTQTCGDLNGSHGVNYRDYLLALAEYGNDTTEPFIDDEGYVHYRHCLDRKTSRDGYVDHDDVVALEGTLSSVGLSMCDLEPLDPGPGLGVLGLPTSGLLIAGKSASPVFQPNPDEWDPNHPEDQWYSPDQLYPHTDSAAPTGAPLNTAAPTFTGRYLGSHRLTRAPNGTLYQLNATQGLVRLDNAARVTMPQAFPDPRGGAMVYVGVWPTGLPNGNELEVGLPLLDAAFDPSRAQSDWVYVAPVVIVPDGQASRGYRAAAKLQIDPSAPAQSTPAYSVLQVLGADPASETDNCTNALPDQLSECNAQGLREIEVDAAGNVYVLACRSANANDYVRVFNSSGAESRRALSAISSALTGAGGMMISADGAWLYLSSSLDSDSTTAQTHVYRIDTSGLTLAQDMTVDFTGVVGGLPDYGAGHLALLTALVENTVDHTVYALGLAAPRFPGDYGVNLPEFDQTAALPGRPVRCILPAAPNDAGGPFTGSELAPHAGATTPLGAPFSGVFLGISGSPPCPGDVDADHDVDLVDLAILLSNFGSSVPSAPGDFDGDDDVDLSDLATLLSSFGQSCP